MFEEAFAGQNIMELLGIASVCLFFAVFTFRLLLCLDLNEKHLEKMRMLPLDENLKTNSGNGD